MIVLGLGGLSSIPVKAPPPCGRPHRVRMIAEKRMGKPDQPILLQNHDFMSVVAEERGVENIGNSPIELVEIELK